MAAGDKFTAKKGWPTVDIIIQEKGDIGFDKKLGLDEEKDVIWFASLEKAFILKGAMESGKCSVTLYAKMEDGTHVALETSGNMIKMIASVVLGIDGM